VMFVPRVDSVLRAGKVYVLKPEGIRTDVNTTLLRDAHEHNLDCLRMITDGRGGWSAEGRPGVPSQGMYQVAVGDGQRILTDQDTAPVAWSSVITVLLLGQGQADADLNLRAMPNFFNSKIVKMWKEAGKGSLIVASGEADPDKGKVELTKINAGRHVLVVTMLTDTAYYVWVTERNLPKKGRVEFKAAAQGATESPLVEVDKEGKI
jgi:hypothetical protein